MTTQVRPARPDDVPGLVALADDVLPATYGPIDAAYAEHVRATWWAPDDLAASVARISHWVAVDEDRVVGVANLGAVDDLPVMWKLYVHPEWHGSGLGTALLFEVEGAVPGTTLDLEYLAGNDPAADFYRRRGFVETRRQGSDADFPHLEWVWMRKDL